MSTPIPLRARAILRDEFIAKSIALYLYDKHDGKTSVVKPPLVCIDVEDGVGVEETAVLDYAAAQALMDDLWTCGLRPSEGSGSAGQLAAVQYHLEDMRRLVFNK
jgi:hypothetical protein